MNFTEIFNGMVGKDFIVAFNDNFRKADTTFLSILATMLYKVKSTDIKEFKVIDGVVSYTLEDAPEEGEEDTRSWTPVDITRWGNINGSLEDQLDLKEALDSKAALDTVVEMNNILSTLRNEFNILRDNYESTEVVVDTNKNDIADLKEVNKTKVNSANIKGIRVSDAEFQWTLDGITWYAMQRTTSIAWGNLTGDINSQDDLMALFRDINTNVSALGDTVTNLSNLISTKSAEIDTISDKVDLLEDQLTADEEENTTKFNTINGKLSDLEDADVGLNNKIDAHTADEENPHRVTKNQVGLGNVDNTADMDKPVSNPQMTYIDEQIAASVPDISGLVKKSGDVSSLFVGTEEIYDNIDSQSKQNTLAFILYNDWRSSIINSISVASTTPLGVNDIFLTNKSNGKYNDKTYKGTFDSSGNATISNIPEGKYAFSMFTTSGDGTQYTTTSKYVTVDISADMSSVNIPNLVLANEYEYIDSLVLWVQSGITIQSVTTADGTRSISRTNTIGEVPKTGYEYYILTDNTQSSDPDYVNGVLLGDYVITYTDLNGDPQTMNVTVDKTKIFTPIIIEGGNE